MGSLCKTLLAFALLHFVLQSQISLLLQYLLTSYFCIPVPYNVVCKGFPTFRSHLRMRPVSRRHSRRGLVGGSTFRRSGRIRSNTQFSAQGRHAKIVHKLPNSLFSGSPTFCLKCLCLSFSFSPSLSHSPCVSVSRHFLCPQCLALFTCGPSPSLWSELP